MGSNLIPFRQEYGKYTEILPEEINKKTILELKDLHKQIIDDLDKDLDKIKFEIKTKFKHFDFNKFKKPSYLVKKTFLIRSDSLKLDSEKVVFCFAKLLIMKNLLIFLSEKIYHMPETVRKNYQNYLNLPKKIEINVSRLSNLQEIIKKQLDMQLIFVIY